MKRILTIAILFLFVLNTSAQQNNTFSIAFGSCNRQNLPQPMWDVIGKDKPNLWLWLGDNIYGDTDDMTILKGKYGIQLNNEGYKKFVANTKIMGTWDDHDYGRNDAGIGYPHKKESQQLALDFLNISKESPLRKIEGLYSANTYQVGSKTVKVILLDGRYHRDTLMKDADKNYIPNTNGDILGKAQWKWLKKELKSKADAYIIGSGVQILSAEHPYEKWENFPAARKRLLDLLVKTKVKGAILLSGDRHIGEFSKMEVKGLNFPLYDVTSSGLTHSATNNNGEANQYRVGPLVNQKHYGLMEFSHIGNKLSIKIQLKGIETPVYHTEEIIF
jgi:alkaline phosphatase D